MDYSGARCQECKFLRVNSVTKATKQCLLVCLLNRWGRSFTVMYKFASDLSPWYVWRLWIAFPTEKPSWKVKTIKTLLFYGMGDIAFPSSSTYIKSFSPVAFQRLSLSCTGDISPIASRSPFSHDPWFFSAESADRILQCNPPRRTCNQPCDPRAWQGNAIFRLSRGVSHMV